MKSKDVEKMIIGSIKEILQHSRYFYHSTVSADYCHLTDAGNDAILDVVNILGARLIDAVAREDIERSKDLVLNELKGK